MDNQTEQQKQNLNQNQGQGSDSSKSKIKIEIGDPVEISSTEQVNSGDHQDKEKVIDQPQKSKRPRKTLEQEIAELEAKRERLIEKKRRQEAHEKIVFGSTIISMLISIKKDDNIFISEFCNKLENYIKDRKNNNKKIIMNIIKNIKD